ncbi:MAG: hypothetical protein ACR2RE_15950 [Geminicoccaceae bacterium]
MEIFLEALLFSLIVQFRLILLDTKVEHAQAPTKLHNLDVNYRMISVRWESVSKRRTFAASTYLLPTVRFDHGMAL